MFWSVGWPLLWAGGFFCNLDILYGGLGLGKLQFLILKKFNFFFSCYFFQFLVIKALDPDWIRIRIRKKWIRIRNTADKLTTISDPDLTNPRVRILSYNTTQHRAPVQYLAFRTLSMTNRNTLFLVNVKLKTLYTCRFPWNLWRYVCFSRCCVIAERIFISKTNSTAVCCISNKYYFRELGT